MSCIPSAVVCFVFVFTLKKYSTLVNDLRRRESEDEKYSIKSRDDKLAHSQRSIMTSDSVLTHTKDIN